MRGRLLSIMDFKADVERQCNLKCSPKSKSGRVTAILNILGTAEKFMPENWIYIPEALEGKACNPGLGLLIYFTDTRISSNHMYSNTVDLSILILELHH